MLKKIARGIQFPQWAGENSRWRRLDIWDRILDGTFYDHLSTAFYEEGSASKSSKPIEERRPSAQYRLPRMVARWSSRRMFASRHQPKVGYGKDKAKQKQITKFLQSIQFWPTMLCAAYFGSVGAVAITFRIDENEKIALKVRRAKFCTPTIDEQNELTNLRLHIPAKGKALLAIGFKDLEDDGSYWFIRDYEPDREITYQPVKQADWNPEQGFVNDDAKKKGLVPAEGLDDAEIEHKFGFVPAAWVVNLVGGQGEDGTCTWEDAVPNSIDIDYTLSQVGRGVRYNCAPQPVVKGQLIGANTGPDGVTRSPTEVWNIQAGFKDESGMTYGDGDAFLLEMKGEGIKAALELIDKLRELALEQIAASRKSPEHMKGVLSGRAMEFLEEDAQDLILDLRTQYGDRSALPLIRRLVAVGMKDSGIDPAQITLQWPRLFQPTPEDLGRLIPALVQAITPVAPQADPNRPQPVRNADGSTRVPDSEPMEQHANVGKSLLTIEQASTYLTHNMDLSMYDTDEDIDEPDDETDPDGDRVSEEQDPADSLVPGAQESLDANPGEQPNSPEPPGGAAAAAASAGATASR